MILSCARLVTWRLQSAVMLTKQRLLRRAARCYNNISGFPYLADFEGKKKTRWNHLNLCICRGISLHFSGPLSTRGGACIRALRGTKELTNQVTRPLLLSAEKFNILAWEGPIREILADPRGYPRCEQVHVTRLVRCCMMLQIHHLLCSDMFWLVWKQSQQLVASDSHSQPGFCICFGAFSYAFLPLGFDVFFFLNLFVGT